MKVYRDELLSKYTTVRIGGITKTMLVPETVEELINIIAEESPKYFVGGGSNLLISDEHDFEVVVSLREFDKSIENNGDGRYTVGASVRLQQLINAINMDGYGGIEYLYSVPGLVGGAIVMNAGGSVLEGNAISDFIVSVTVLKEGKVIRLPRSKCDFSYRDSIFKKEDACIVLSVEFQFQKQTMNISKKKIVERQALTKKIHDLSYPNFGSVFKVYNSRIMCAILKFPWRNKKGVCFSKKTQNWLINKGDGTYRQARRKIAFIKLIHRLFSCDCIEEVVIWK